MRRYSLERTRRYDASVAFETPSFEIGINAALQVILNSAVDRLPAFSKRNDCYENYVHGASMTNTSAADLSRQVVASSKRTA
jgi:hypothetical protein